MHNQHKIHQNQKECINKSKSITNDTLREEYLKALRVLKHHNFLIETVQIQPVSHMYPDQQKRYVIGISDEEFKADMSDQKKDDPENFIDIDLDSDVPVEPIETDPKKLIRFCCWYGEWFFDVILWNDITGFYLTAGPFDGPAYRAFMANFYYTVFDYQEAQKSYYWMNYYLNLT